MKRIPDVIGWGGEWRQTNKVDGARRHLLFDENCLPVLFKTRLETRRYIERVYGYIRTRPDLRAEPHGWRMPVAVRVVIRVEGGR